MSVLELAGLFRSWDTHPETIWTLVEIESLFIEIINSTLSVDKKQRLVSLMTHAVHKSEVIASDDFFTFMACAVSSVVVYTLIHPEIEVRFPDLSGWDREVIDHPHFSLTFESFGASDENRVHK
jgi:histidinol phosphatase-like PHP family hydrolase